MQGPECKPDRYADDHSNIASQARHWAHNPCPIRQQPEGGRGVVNCRQTILEYQSNPETCDKYQAGIAT
jgi:hypothetical protein